jgi:ubiquinone/menaquinone biosynthesis C-methylase UbiE
MIDLRAIQGGNGGRIVKNSKEEKAELLMEMADAPITRLQAELAFRYLYRHLESELKRGNGELNILDVGSGIGEVALRFAAQGHKVTMLEPQACLLETAEERAREQLPERSGYMRFLNERIEDLEGSLSEEFSLIICHETIEYVDDPLRAFNVISRVLKPRGTLSLVFRNRYGLIVEKVIEEGNIPEAMNTFETEEFATKLHKGHGHLYSDTEITALLDPLGYNIEGQYGLLVFSDYIDCSLFEDGQCYKGMLALEEKAGEESHLKSISKYVQLICTKA